jgi:hypothetical protein
MGTLRTRIERIEQQMPPVEASCPHPCHGPARREDDGITVRTVDYRQAVAPLCADPETAQAAYLAQFCPTCGEPAAAVAIRAVDLPCGAPLFGPGRLTPHPDDTPAA